MYIFFKLWGVGEEVVREQEEEAGDNIAKHLMVRIRIEFCRLMPRPMQSETYRCQGFLGVMQDDYHLRF